MSNLEAGIVIDKNWEQIYLHVPDGRSAAYLPDSQELWDVIWANRDIICGVAHSHPGSGCPSPSGTDLTTFAAVEAGLGQRLVWPIITSDCVGMFKWGGYDRLGYDLIFFVDTNEIKPYWVEPLWVKQLRKNSYY